MPIECGAVTAAFALPGLTDRRLVRSVDFVAMTRELKKKYKALRQARANQRNDRYMSEQAQALLNRFDENGDRYFERSDFLKCVYTVMDEMGMGQYTPSDTQLDITFADLSFEKEGLLHIEEIRELANIFVDVDIIKRENECVKRVAGVLAGADDRSLILCFFVLFLPWL